MSRPGGRAARRRVERGQVARIRVRGAVRTSVAAGLALGLLTEDVRTTLLGAATAGLWWSCVDLAERTAGRWCGLLLGVPATARGASRPEAL